MIRVDTTEPPGTLGAIPGEPPVETVVGYEDAMNRVTTTWKQCAKEAADVGISMSRPILSYLKSSMKNKKPYCVMLQK